MMNNADIKEFAARSWGEVSGHDRRYWASLYRNSGFPATANASMALWQHMKSVRKDWPDAAERRLDLDHHLAFKQLLDRIADALATGRSIQRS